MYIGRILLALLCLWWSISVQAKVIAAPAPKVVSYPVIKVALDQEMVQITHTANSDDKVMRGPVITNLDCIAKRVPFKYEVYTADWTRAQYLFKNHVFDMIIASKNDVRDTFASLSTPLVQESFVFVFDPNSFVREVLPADLNALVRIIKQRNYSVAIKLGSAEAEMLKKLGITNLRDAKDVDEMASIQKERLVDVFVNDLALVQAYEKQHNVQFKKRFIANIPKGYYVHKKLLQAYPEILTDINKALQHCPFSKAQ